MVVTSFLTNINVDMFLVMLTVTTLRMTSAFGPIFHNGYSYAFVHDRKDWSEAQAICRGYGGNLAEPDSQIEDDWMRDQAILMFPDMPQLRYNGKKWIGFWIGVNDIEQEGTFVKSDGTNINYENWGSGQPNSLWGDQDCTMRAPAHSYAWNDFYCDESAYFICKKGRATTLVHKISNVYWIKKKYS